MRFWPCFLAALALALPSAARAEKFRYKYRPGQVVQYRANMAGATMMGQPGSEMMKSTFRMGLRQTQRVRSVTAGVITLDIKDQPVSGSSTMMGQTEQANRTPTSSVVRLTERGRFLSRKSSEDGKAKAGSPMDGLDALYGLNFPDRDLKPGETWEDTVTVGTGPAAQKVRVKTRYVGQVSFRGRTCARFSTTLATNLIPESDEPAPESMPGTSGKMTGTVTTYFDPALGLELYSSGSVVMVVRADFTQVSPEGGELATAMKINVVQSLVQGRK